MKSLKIVRTIVGFYNVYDLDTGAVVNQPPTTIAKVFPGLDRKVRIKITEVTEEQAVKLGLFGRKAVAV